LLYYECVTFSPHLKQGKFIEDSKKQGKSEPLCASHHLELDGGGGDACKMCECLKMVKIKCFQKRGGSNLIISLENSDKCLDQVSFSCTFTLQITILYAPRNPINFPDRNDNFEIYKGCENIFSLLEAVACFCNPSYKGGLSRGNSIRGGQLCTDGAGFASGPLFGAPLTSVSGRVDQRAIRSPTRT